MEVPEYLNSDYYGVGEEQFSLENLKSDENFAVEEYLLDFSNEDVAMTIGIFDNAPGNSSDSSTVTAVDSCNSSVFDVDNQFSEAQFSHELYIPYDDLAELEWLSNFAEDSLSREEKDIHFDWSTRRHHLDAPAETKTLKTDAPPCKKREVSNYESIGRKCLHCAAEKTPQWRTGPMGPKTLCNACGVRFKSGRLVPEYRPASSPTFISTKHSNSHRKVLELRRQKEEIQSSVFCTTNGCDEFLIDYRNGRDFSYLI